MNASKSEEEEEEEEERQLLGHYFIYVFIILSNVNMWLTGGKVVSHPLRVRIDDIVYSRSNVHAM